MRILPDTPISAEAQKLVFEVTKQLITLSVVALGFLTSMLFTTFKGTQFIPSAMISLFSFLLCASCGVLTQLAVLAEAMSDRQALSWYSPGRTSSKGCRSRRRHTRPSSPSTS
jgi:hypothetical protein